MAHGTLPVLAGIQHGRLHPRREGRGIMQRHQPAPGVAQYFLHQILRRLPLPRVGIGHQQEHGPIMRHQPVKGGMVTCQRPPHQQRVRTICSSGSFVIHL